MLFTTIISIAYSNVLQSIIVVPEVREVELSFDDMVDQGFQFLSTRAPQIRSLAHRLYDVDPASILVNSTDRKAGKWDFARQERLLGQMVVTLDTVNASLLLTLTQANRKVLIEGDFIADAYASLIQSYLGRNAAKGGGRFFHFLSFWVFAANKSYMLTKAFEWMNSAGLVSYFMEDAVKVRSKMFVEKVIASAEQEGSWKRDFLQCKQEGGSAGFSDSVLAECIFVLAYGISLSTIGLVVEITSHRWMSAAVGCWLGLRSWNEKFRLGQKPNLK